MQFTPAQQQAIDEQGTNILVAAAAGSGKTAVLVERIIQKILQKHAQIDELIVLTFTNAAAAEMRVRIRQRLEQALETSAEPAYIQAQLQLMNQAQISTFHTFCLQILRQYYYAIDLDPQFRIGDEYELALLQTQALEEVLERHYEQGTATFLTFVEAYSSDRGDEGVQELIMQLANFQQAIVNRDQWQEMALANFAIEPNFFQTPIGAQLALTHQKRLAIWQAQLQQAREALDLSVKNAEKAELIIETYQGRITASATALKTNDWQTYQAQLQLVSVPNWPMRVAPEAKAMIDEVKKAWIEHVETYAIAQEAVNEQASGIRAQLSELFTLTIDYVKTYQKLKQQRNIVDFSDLEQKTLTLLQQEPAITQAYQTRIQEILVDEYQDTNEVQETIVQLCSNGQNVFMVGDVKQSIYRFRSADPSLFQHKYREYKMAHGAGTRIDLNQNFRSRETVLDFINYIFVQLMDQQFAEIAYDETAKLYPGAAYPAHEHMGVECHVLVQPSEGDKVENEAHFLIQKIQQLIASEVLVTIKGETRPIRYADIALLFRGRSALYERVSELLKAAHIPYVAQEQGSYFDASEIRTLLAILRIVDNPFDDIEYTSWLRSPIVGCDENDLLVLRQLAKHEPFCLVTQQLNEQQVSASLYQKIQRAQAYEQQWRVDAKQKSLAEWLEQVLAQTGYYDFIGGLANGIHRQANIDALIEKARTYEAIGFRGLFKFNRFIATMQKQNRDFTNSRSIAEQENVVQLMTIHKSKGLEFPVVILAELNKKLNKRDQSKPLTLDKDFGAALPFFSVEKHATVRSIVQNFLNEQGLNSQLAEELRILYVALTRAKEKLILVAQTPKDLAKIQAQLTPVLVEQQPTLSPELRQKAQSYFEWIMQALARHQSLAAYQSQLVVADPTIMQAPLQLALTLHEQPFGLADDEPTSAELQQLQAVMQQQLLAPIQVPAVEQSLAFTYPYQQATQQYAQVSISDLKRMQAETTESSYEWYAPKPAANQAATDVFALPRFLRAQQPQQALERGNAYHQLMQYLPQTTLATKVSVEGAIIQCLKDEEMQAHINPEWIVQFLATPLGAVFQQAQTIQRELPFSMLRQAADIYEQWEGEAETVVMRGIFDALYHCETEIIVVDYKTDFVATFDAEMQQHLRARYQLQMETYLHAARQLFAGSGKTIRGELYFFQAQASLAF